MRYVWRCFHAERSSELLRCVAMRLLLRLWRTSGKAWPPLRALLLPSSEEEDVRLRLARAACVRDVCEADGQRGVELVKAIEEALRDAHPGVAALVSSMFCSQYVCRPPPCCAWLPTFDADGKL